MIGCEATQFIKTKTNTNKVKEAWGRTNRVKAIQAPPKASKTLSRPD
jgi:hypothetical protein